ncbi:hypothetical protein SUGI_0318490 [Cryptomeria japonica]|nr:hypothetical protein SUGI_0318490 [Cryptomeria japonica]
MAVSDGKPVSAVETRNGAFPSRFWFDFVARSSFSKDPGCSPNVLPEVKPWMDKLQSTTLEGKRSAEDLGSKEEQDDTSRFMDQPTSASHSGNNNCTAQKDDVSTFSETFAAN